MTISESLTILYVLDQKRSADFYATVLDRAPRLDVPGMTEIPLTESSVLGLMPVAGILRLLGSAIPDPARAEGIPRVELYLRVDDAAAALHRAGEAGGRIISDLELRNWGDRVGYALDPDGHVLAFAEEPR